MTGAAHLMQQERTRFGPMRAAALPPPHLQAAARHTAALLAAAMLLASLAIAQANFTLMRDVALQRYGQDTAELVDTWRSEIEIMKGLPDEEKLARANRFFNSRIRWVTDDEA